MFAKRHNLPRETAEKYRRGILLFFLRNGLPFSLIDDANLAVFDYLPSCDRLKAESRDLSANISGIIKNMLRDAEYTTVTMDEWCNVMKSRYVGVSCHTTVSGVLRVFTIAHISLNVACSSLAFDHANSELLAGLARDVMEDYGIHEKTLLIVTDSASIMKTAANALNGHRIGEGKRPIMWVNCVAHTINLLMGKVVTLLHDRMEHVFSLQRKLMSSEVFESFLLRKECKITGIPTYSSVRWYSLFEMMRKMTKLKDMIIEFTMIEKLRPVPSDVWDTLEDFEDFITVVK